MKLEQESIFTSSIRAFCVAFFAILGIGIAFIPVILFLGGIFGAKNESDIPFEYTVLPNGEGHIGTIHANTPLLLQINIDGVIGSEQLHTGTIQELLLMTHVEEFKTQRIKGILLHINSPGGTVFDANNIYRLIQQYKQELKIPVYAYVEGLCASGGMYIACSADKIYATSVSLVGSVGVIMNFFNFSDGLSKIGVGAMTLTQGNGKDDMNPFRPWKPGESQSFQQIMVYYYHQFLDIVLAARPTMTQDLLVNQCGAHVFPAPEAKSYGYIDAIEDDEKAVVSMLATAAGIHEKESYQLIRIEKKHWLQMLVKGQSPLFTGKIEHHLSLPKSLETQTMNGFLYLYQPETQASTK
jgi:protease-4